MAADWFFTSDREHTPWHAKNLWLAVWFDQGWVGSIALTLLIMLAVARAFPGKRFVDEWSVPRIAALAGFCGVGLFDSLLDVPRVEFLFYLLLLSALVRPVGIPGRESADGG
jgi:hypothetical protein